MNGKKIDLGLTAYDELFMDDAGRTEAKLPRIYDIPLSEIDDFPDHPFQVRLDEDMDQLVQSIKDIGLITPVTLRQKENGRYEIISGHRRRKACELAGFDTVKAEIRELTRDEAIILMVESNLQRSVILPSEKAFALLMCVTMFAGLGTAAFAASEKGMVYLNVYPASGDSSDSSLWGHGALNFMNGWSTSAGSKLFLRSINSFTGNVCYCLEPGRPQNSGEYLYSYDERFWDNLPGNLNSTLTPDEIKTTIGRIMQYGYIGTLDPNWKTQNSADADKLAHVIATQMLIWETVVGERDSSFKHVDTGSCDAVFDQVNKNHPLRSRIDSYYNSMVAGVQTHTKTPVFTAKTAAKAQIVSLEWDGAQYSATLTDSNNVLGNYTFSADGLSFSKSGNKLTITAKTAPAGVVTVIADKTNSLRKGLITWSDGKINATEGRQDVVSYTAGVNDPVRAYLKVDVKNGNLKIIKTSDDGNVSGIIFTVTGNGVNETVKTDENGNVEVKNLKPDTYTVTEQVPEGYIPRESQTAAVEAGKTAVVNFSNVAVKGSVELTKVDADYPENKLTGAVFEVYSDTDSDGEFKPETSLWKRAVLKTPPSVFSFSSF